MKIKNTILLLLLSFLITSVTSYADNIDKKGKTIYETIRPTAAVKENEDAISDAQRKKTDVLGGKDATKNIFSNNTMMPEESQTISTISNVTLIRHTVSIADVPTNRYEVIEDRNYDRIRLKIKETGVGEWYAKNGFYRIEGKVYYFDEQGLMVIGNAIDNMGRKYYFSLETGELLYEE